MSRKNARRLEETSDIIKSIQTVFDKLQRNTGRNTFDVKGMIDKDIFISIPLTINNKTIQAHTYKTPYHKHKEYGESGSGESGSGSGSGESGSGSGSGEREFGSGSGESGSGSGEYDDDRVYANELEYDSREYDEERVYYSLEYTSGDYDTNTDMFPYIETDVITKESLAEKNETLQYLHSNEYEFDGKANIYEKTLENILHFIEEKSEHLTNIVQYISNPEQYLQSFLENTTRKVYHETFHRSFERNITIHKYIVAQV